MKYKKCMRCVKKFEVADMSKLTKAEKSEAIAMYVLGANRIKGEEFLPNNLCDNCKKDYEKKIVPKLKKEIDKWIKQKIN